jgi:hypothetical protein
VIADAGEARMNTDAASDLPSALVHVWEAVRSNREA